ncbi:FAD dependent oxidoreductase [Fistulina hepatica ATCC 64428]|uniref:FAD dependent oxidoreductase n=1 Tax=Fistulina hepatica ATCC 64428 TaxID=1128425 RepID=A0A0D7AB16_9AGAR|nr:FAD dependent oxidoreductase [Fistulina hepatica ATCC 64428]KIY50078.1 FAD dependent oxidoreductase [Fistulina hepatica ATCC 64428]
MSARLDVSPGLPLSDPSIPFWAIPVAPIARHGEHGPLPEIADIVVIGSGITGASFVRELLDSSAVHPPRVVMLDARDACSGATARNGGHISPMFYMDYDKLKSSVGPEAACNVIRFRLAHLPELLAVASSEGLLRDSQCRQIEAVDVFFEQSFFDESKAKLSTYLEDFPDQRSHWRVVDTLECHTSLQLSKRAVGAIATRGGALSPYRLVTGILARLLKAYPSAFALFTHTPCESISSGSDYYTIHTPKGDIHTRHVVHATNGWVSHLLSPMRRKVVPLRGTMTAQRPGTGLGKNTNPDWTGSRSFIFYTGKTYTKFDYLTQQPATDYNGVMHIPQFCGAAPPGFYPSPSGELMLGGGFSQDGIGESALLAELGNANDRDDIGDGGCLLGPAMYLGGALSILFDASAWSAEGRDHTDTNGGLVNEGRVKKMWTGILGISADMNPWVGRRMSTMTSKTPLKRSPRKRTKPADAASVRPPQLAPPGEWLSAGYTGEGMTHAWMCGKALAHMVLGQDNTRLLVGMCENSPDEGLDARERSVLLPASFKITESRWKKARIEDLLEVM